jgi:hypothetical protein
LFGELSWEDEKEVSPWTGQDGAGIKRRSRAIQLQEDKERSEAFKKREMFWVAPRSAVNVQVLLEGSLDYGLAVVEQKPYRAREVRDAWKPIGAICVKIQESIAFKLLQTVSELNLFPVEPSQSATAPGRNRNAVVRHYGRFQHVLNDALET